eukprot:scaffold26783_cov47-Phaeocystis_antarctica.AAC.7
MRRSSCFTLPSELASSTRAWAAAIASALSTATSSALASWRSVRIEWPRATDSAQLTHAAAASLLRKVSAMSSLLSGSRMTPRKLAADSATACGTMLAQRGRRHADCVPRAGAIGSRFQGPVHYPSVDPGYDYNHRLINTV